MLFVKLGSEEESWHNKYPALSQRVQIFITSQFSVSRYSLRHSLATLLAAKI